MNQAESENLNMKVLLREYLGQYYASRVKKRQLEERLRTFRQEMVGARAIQYSATPTSRTNAVGDGPASVVIRAMEIEDQIKAQQKEMAKTMLNVMKIMDFLPKKSMERIVLEYRHIDCLSWKQITKETHYSRAMANNYYNQGIDKLLEFKKVQRILGEFASEINAMDE